MLGGLFSRLREQLPKTLFYVEISNYPSENIQDISFWPAAEGFANKHLFGTFHLYPSGLLVKKDTDLARPTVRLGLDLESCADRIASLCLDPREERSKATIIIPSYYPSLYFNGGLELHTPNRKPEYGITVPLPEIKRVSDILLSEQHARERPIPFLQAS